MSAKTDEILESLKSLSLLEASELVKQIEEAFGVSAAASAGVVMAAPGAAGGGGGEAAEEKSEFDVIVVGTGLVESIVAAAVARIGKSVVHLDPNDFYGGEWASFPLQQLVDYLESSEARHHLQVTKEKFASLDCEPRVDFGQVLVCPFRQI